MGDLEDSPYRIPHVISHSTAYKNLTTFRFYCATQICIACVCYGDVAGWLAGWLDVTRQYCIKTAKSILKLFRPFGSRSPIILVSSDLATIPNFKGKPFTGALNRQGVWKIGDFRAIFDGNRRLSRKRCEIGRRLLWNVNRKSWMPD